MYSMLTLNSSPGQLYCGVGYYKGHGLDTLLIARLQDLARTQRNLVIINFSCPRTACNVDELGNKWMETCVELIFDVINMIYISFLSKGAENIHTKMATVGRSLPNYSPWATAQKVPVRQSYVPFCRLPFSS